MCIQCVAGIFCRHMGNHSVGIILRIKVFSYSKQTITAKTSSIYGAVCSSGFKLTKDKTSSRNQQVRFYSTGQLIIYQHALLLYPHRNLANLHHMLLASLLPASSSHSKLKPGRGQKLSIRYEVRDNANELHIYRSHCSLRVFDRIVKMPDLMNLKILQLLLESEMVKHSFKLRFRKRIGAQSYLSFKHIITSHPR